MRHQKIIITLSAILWILSYPLTLSASDALGLLLSDNNIDKSATSVLVIDLSTGKSIENHNSEMPLCPASLMKTITIASLINQIKIDYKYHTKIYTTGKIEDGVLNGNILVIGSGDPSLNSSRGPESQDIISECIEALKKLGITTITGKIEIDSSIFPPPSTPSAWLKEDLRHAYGTGCHGFNFENNKNGSTAVKNPTATFTSRLTEACAADSIKIIGKTLKSSTDKCLLVDHESATIDEIMRSCMMRSDNLYAEALLRTYALAKGASATTANGAKFENEYWKNQGFDTSNINILDGSGLSRTNKMTASFLGKVLLRMSHNIDYVSFFPLAGQEGTLKDFLKDSALDSYIALKTGSMRGVQCYAGYKLDDNYAPTHAIVIIINNFKNARSNIRKKCEQMLLEIFKDI